MSKTEQLPDWELVLSFAARSQRILPDAEFVGGIASVIYAEYRFSREAEHVPTDLREHFDEVFAQLESVAGLKTARVKHPVQILGSLDGIETGVRHLIRDEPLKTTVFDYRGQSITVPAANKILRIKGVLILRRNATRDYLDFAALAARLEGEKVGLAFQHFDCIYPQASGESSLQQLLIQLASPMPYDLEEIELSEYKNLAPRWHDWNSVKTSCSHFSTVIFDRVCEMNAQTSRKKQHHGETFSRDQQ